jgi:ribosome-binding ATPase YchF (GTP1/OBG family)
MKFAILGTQGSGKSTLFSILTGSAYGSTHPKGYISGRGTTDLPDARLDRLFDLTRGKRKIYTQIEVDDSDAFGKMWKEDRSGEIFQSLVGFDAFIQVVGEFAGQDALSDFDEIDLRMILSDLSMVSNRLERLEKERKVKKIDEREIELLKRLQGELGQETPLSQIDISDSDREVLVGFGFTSNRPKIVVFNRSEESVRGNIPSELLSKLEEKNVLHLSSPLEVEMEILQLTEEEQAGMRAEFGLKRPVQRAVFEELFSTLDTMFFYTTAHDEVRAWPIPKGTTALHAAGKVHTDMERGFIRAEVVSCDDLFRLGSLKAAKEEGLVKLEGKDYVVQDGDVLYIRFNV